MAAMIYSWETEHCGILYRILGEQKYANKTFKTLKGALNFVAKNEIRLASEAEIKVECKKMQRLGYVYVAHKNYIENKAHWWDR